VLCGAGGAVTLAYATIAPHNSLISTHVFEQLQPPLVLEAGFSALHPISRGDTMLELYFSNPTSLRKLRRGPLNKVLDEWAVVLHEAGYKHSSASQILSLAARFSRYLQRLGVDDVTIINEELAGQFLNAECFPYGKYDGCDYNLHSLLAYLRERQLIPPLSIDPITDPAQLLLARYSTFLRTVRGVASSTYRSSMLCAERFLAFYRERDPRLDLTKLSAKEVLDFLTQWYAYRSGKPWQRHLAQDTRNFIRFLRWEGIVTQELERVVKAPRQYSLSSVPKHLPWNVVEELLAGVDPAHPQAKRDRAILCLLAYLGLRASEVVNLTFADINWRAGMLTIPNTKTRYGRIVPLVEAAGEALSDYILHERLPVNIPQVFVRANAPYGPMASSHGVSQMVSRHLTRLQIPAPKYGAHLLRHSLATHLINHGTSAKGVADMLGHMCINTTAIYAKVNTTQLLEAALEFPTGGIQ
jgi:integrase/recombinase XerD